MEEVLVRNAADEVQVKKAERKQLYGRERELSDINEILSSANGRRFLWSLMERCKMFETSFSSDGLQMSYNEGKRVIGLSILADISEINPDAYLLMMNEAKKGKEKWQTK